MDIATDDGSQPIVPLPEADEAGLGPGSLQQALTVLRADAMLEQQAHLLLLLTWVDRAHIAGVGMAEPDAVPAVVHTLGQIGFAR
jgi:hypothetical protein